MVFLTFQVKFSSVVQHSLHFDLKRAVSSVLELFAKHVRDWLLSTFNQYDWVFDTIIGVVNGATCIFSVSKKSTISLPLGST